MENLNDIDFSVKNKEIGEAVIYRNYKPCTLIFTLKNQTQSDIPFKDKPTIIISIPQIYGEDINKIECNDSDWSLKVEEGDEIILTYVGDNDKKWIKNESLEFSLDNVAITTDTNLDFRLRTELLKLLLENFDGYRSSLMYLLSISNPPEGKHRLEIGFFPDSNLIYISPSGEATLKNELSFAIINKSNVPLFKGEKSDQGSPQIEILFVYGCSSGCLTPATEQQGGKYAWKICGSILSQTESCKWRIENPKTTDVYPFPKWILKPEGGNVDLIGIGKDASFSIKFSDIIALSSVGVTQMIVNFSGFKKNASTYYDDTSFFIPIDKKGFDKTQSVITELSTDPLLNIYDPNKAFDLNLMWTCVNTTKLEIKIDVQTNESCSTDLTDTSIQGAFSIDQAQCKLRKGTVKIDQIPSNTTKLIVTAFAYNGEDKFEYTKTYRIDIKRCYYLERKSGKIYPGKEIGGMLWTTYDLSYDCFYAKVGNRDTANTFLYQWNDLNSFIKKTGWRLPTIKDWDALL